KATSSVSPVHHDGPGFETLDGGPAILRAVVDDGGHLVVGGDGEKLRAKLLAPVHGHLAGAVGQLQFLQQQEDLVDVGGGAVGGAVQIDHGYLSGDFDQRFSSTCSPLSFR